MAKCRSKTKRVCISNNWQRFCYIPFYKIHAYSTVGINNSHTKKNKNKKWKELTSNIYIYIYIFLNVLNCSNITHTYTIKMFQNGHHLR